MVQIVGLAPLYKVGTKQKLFSVALSTDVRGRNNMHDACLWAWLGSCGLDRSAHLIAMHHPDIKS